MFRRLPVDLPKDPHYPADLDKLGFTLTPDGRFVRKDNPNIYFNFFHTDNERANEVHKEAMHECARHTVLRHLHQLGVQQLYIHDNSISEEKPQDPHVTILATELSELRNKRDVIVVANDHMQHLGIWAYRSLMRDRGLDEGSTVGLVKKLKVLGRDDSTPTPLLEATINNPPKAESIVTASPNRPDDSGPGLIILNPGQLIYSHDLNKCMSQATWLARPKKNALAESILISEEHNRVKGHESPNAHVATTLNSVSSLLHKNARIYIVGIGDGAESVLGYLDHAMAAEVGESLKHDIAAIALVQPMQHPSIGQSPTLRDLLAVRARSWVTGSGQPKGTLLSVPRGGGHSIMVHSGNKSEDEGNSFADEDVNCPTFSSGEEDLQAEMVWPGVMDDVLEWFERVRVEAEELVGEGSGQD